ncbi:MAG: addiction module protein [Gammaproteobacteria bacterium]
MKQDIETITELALKLPPQRRARIAEILVESLDYEEDFTFSDAWRMETLKRCQEIDSDPSLLIDVDSIMADLRPRYS